MSKRDHEVVEDYKKIFSTMFQSPHLHPLQGVWYLVTGRDFEAAEIIRIEGEIGARAKKMKEDAGYTFTLLLIYKVDVDELR